LYDISTTDLAAVERHPASSGFAWNHPRSWAGKAPWALSRCRCSTHIKVYLEVLDFVSQGKPKTRVSEAIESSTTKVPRLSGT
jgi:hypothetical protein